MSEGLAAAVDRFFDRVEALMPKYVSTIPALVVSVCASLVVLSFGLLVVDEHKKEMKDEKNVLKRDQWKAFLIVLVVVTLLLQNLVMKSVYSFSMISANKPHFAWVHWLSKYAAAAKTPFAFG